MFNDKYGLTKAVLEGRKTQTRRVINLKEQLIRDFQLCYYNNTFDFLDGLDLIDCYYANNYEKVPFKVGEIVAIAQKYEDVLHIPVEIRQGAGWNNKLFVSAELMPHQIRITNVRIQRLQDISDEDCLAEGVVVVEPKVKGGVKSYYPCEYLKSCADKVGWGIVFDTTQKAYAALIDKVSGKGTWDSNPYVFVYDFELIK